MSNPYKPIGDPPNGLTWDTDQLLSQVRINHADHTEAHDLVTSIDRTIRIIAFHLYEANKNLDFSVCTDDSGKISNHKVSLILGAHEQSDQFRRQCIAAEAHVLGAMYTVRSLADQFGQLVNGLITKLDEDNIYIYHVVDKVVQDNYQEFKRVLDELVGSPSFKYVAAFVNYSKHRQLIRNSVPINDRWDGLRFRGFNYKSTQYNEKSGKEVLCCVGDVRNRIVRCGVKLNDAYNP